MANTNTNANINANNSGLDSSISPRKIVRKSTTTNVNFIEYNKKMSILNK